MRNQKNKYSNFIPYLIVLLALSSMIMFFNQSATKTLTVNEFYNLFETSSVTSITVAPSQTVVKVSGVYVDAGKNVSFTVNVPNTEESLNEVMTLAKDNVKDMVVVDPYQTNELWDFVKLIIPYAIMIGVVFVIFSKMNGQGNNKAFEFSKSRAKLQGNIKVRFSDVAGCDEEKEEMAELIDYLKNPKKFTKMGAHIPKGVLLVGPPGTGKTLLAKAVAGEANVPFYAISGSDFVEMFVGVGASRVRDMFKNAKKTAPCIIFIDEIDAVGRQRGTGLGGGHDEREQTLNQLLVEMDGIGDNSGVVMIAATNRADVLDPALLRPGRFDRQIRVALPDIRGRKEILEVHAKNKKLSADVDLGAIARRTPGFSGADLENVLNEAAILAVRENKTEVAMFQLDEAIDRVMMGPAKKSRIYSEKEKKLVAYHETGHAIIGLKLESADMVQKVTIIPRGEAGGYNLMLPREENNYITTKTDLIGRITGLLGGRVAEEIIFNEISTGASNDIERATYIARSIVMVYGMSDLGPIQYDQGSGNVFLGRDYAASQSYSGEIAFEIDKEVRKIIDEAYANAHTIISQNRELMDNIANALIEFETLTHEDIMDLNAGKKLDKAPIDRSTKAAEDIPLTVEPTEESGIKQPDAGDSESID